MENLVLLGERRRKLNPIPDVLINDGTVIVDVCHVPLTDEEIYNGGDQNNFQDNDDDLRMSSSSVDGDRTAGGGATSAVTSNARTIVLTSDGVLCKVDDNGDTVWTRNLSKEFHDGNPSIRWFDVTWVDPYLVCLSYGGAVVTVSPHDGETELVGVFDRGLETAAWSPDGEVLLMVTSVDVDPDDDDEEVDDEMQNDEENKFNCVLMAMNSQFEVLAEVDIPTFVPCRAVMADGDATNDDDNDSSKNMISVSWRPDGTLSAVSCVDSDDEIRKIRIYKRDSLQLHATGLMEDASGQLVKNLQETQIGWAGSGCSQLLASAQRKGKKKLQVVFFEPNGLRHREFALRESSPSNTIVMSLNWNATSDLLAVALRDESGEQSIDKVQLWHRCNYHWCIKHEFQYPKGQKVQRVQFSGQHANDLRVIFQSLEWRDYDVRWDPSTITTFNANCLAFVIDGPTLNVTPFDKAVIPPPMSMKNWTLPFPVTCIGFCHSKGQQEGLAILSLSDGSLVSFSCSGTNERNPTLHYKETPVLWGDVKDVDPLTLRSLQPVKCDGEKVFIVAIACASCNESHEKLVEITIEDINDSEPKAHVSNTYSLRGQVFRMIQWSDDDPNGCLLEMKDGSFLEYELSLEGSGLVPSEVDPLPELCPWLAAIKDSSSFTGDIVPSHGEAATSKLVFGLSERSRLYYRDVMLTESASSFWLSLQHEFFCYVTAGSRCQMRFLSLKEMNEIDPLMGMDHNLLMQGYEPRNVERGARVVAIIPEQPQTILQMPRGNLEGIHPRALILRFVMSKIMDRHYGEAFRMMRRHKVDLNLITDIDPEGFLEFGVSTFLQQVDKVDHLNLFIANLQNTDVTQTRFPIPAFLSDETKKKKEAHKRPFDFATKVNQVCSSARRAMLAFEADGTKSSRYYLLPVLSSFAKEDPPRLDEALSLIKQNALKLHPANSKKNPLFSETAQSAIHYVAFLAEYELLFETALGMYDYDIARAVARNSQMDPKVYLPLLKRFNALPTYFSRYEVDCRLKRYDLALNNLYQSYKLQESFVDFEGQGYDQNASLANANSFDSCLALINEHSLHRLGLQLFGNDEEKKTTILLALGEDLLKQMKPKMAMSVFLSASPPHYEEAKRAARAALDWRTYFSLVESELDSSMSVDEQEFHKEKRRQAAREMSEDIITATLGDINRTKQEVHIEASQILLDYGDDLVGAMDVLLKAECWSEAYRVSVQRGRQDLSRKCIDSAVAFAHSSIVAFDDRKNEFESSTTRYIDVLKLRKKAVYIEGPDLGPEFDETGSLFSSASHATNTSLRSTTSTSSTSSASSGISSVISVKSNTTFNLTGSDGPRHKSKFNMGKKQKKKKKQKSRRRAGSPEELQALVNILKSTCPNASYSKIVGDTIQFLVFVQRFPVAEELYQAYNSMCKSIDACTRKRIEETEKEKTNVEGGINDESGDNLHDMNYLLVQLPVEKEIDDLSSAALPTSIVDFFDLSTVA